MNIINKFYHVLEADRCSWRNKKVLVVQQMGLQSEMGEGSGQAKPQWKDNFKTWKHRHGRMSYGDIQRTNVPG